eukprot:TRINITY_DN10928_c0_g1_i1.p1 TRINITY_DN10928_c0_g1~~TRINITY_DN10928_c0_g1_i1.p1  ORF type:complete len:154 (-),score=23.18 TRINITY_DN10928_c0_g1_i1:533-949(-)
MCLQLQTSLAQSPEAPVQAPFTPQRRLRQGWQKQIAYGSNDEDKIYIICEKHASSRLPDLGRKTWAADPRMSCEEFRSYLARRLENVSDGGFASASQSIELYAGKTKLSSLSEDHKSTLSELSKLYAANDNLLYITYR